MVCIIIYNYSLAMYVSWWCARQCIFFRRDGHTHTMKEKKKKIGLLLPTWGQGIAAAYKVRKRYIWLLGTQIYTRPGFGTQTSSCLGGGSNGSKRNTHQCLGLISLRHMGLDRQMELISETCNWKSLQCLEFCSNTVVRARYIYNLQRDQIETCFECSHFVRLIL